MELLMADRFAANGFEPIELDGRLVHPRYWADIDVGDVVRLTWVSAASPRPQGVAVRLRIPEAPGKRGAGGLLQVNDVQSPAIMLWMDSSPDVVELECVKRHAGARLHLSNRWRNKGIEHEWFHNYGILIEELDDDSVFLRCSDGIGAEPTFDDLVVRVDILRRTTRDR